MIPFLVSSQVTDAVVRKPKSEGLRIGIDIRLKKRNKSCMNAMVFNEHGSTVLVPHIARLPPNPGLENEQPFFDG
jgi:hypothetical protein